MNIKPLLAIQEGIKFVGVGKRGSKDLEQNLVEQIIGELTDNKVPGCVKGAFFSGLLMKGVGDSEKDFNKYVGFDIEENPSDLAALLCQNAPDSIVTICRQLFEKQELNQESAYHLGAYIIKEDSCDIVKGLVASLLRVRYETPEEYEGLLNSIEQTFEKPFLEKIPQGQSVLSIAEPFDGVDHSYMITPLLSDFIQTLNYRVISLVGRNSGPKFGNNLRDIGKGLKTTFLTSNHQLNDSLNHFGFYVDQKDLSKDLDRWVDVRRLIIKRPFLATLERFLNPCHARILIASAFHPPYGDKMLTICERAGFPGAIIVRNGMEGTIAFPLMRQAKVLCTAKQADGSYLRHEFMFDSQKFLNMEFKIEERLDNPDIQKNIELITTYKTDGKTEYKLFDSRVKVTCAGLKKAIEWVESNIKEC